MIKNKDLNYFMKLNYNLILRKDGNKFYLFIPELSLITEGKDLNETYKKLEKSKEDYFKRMIGLRAHDMIKVPASLGFRKKVMTDLSLFFVKALIIFLALFLIFLGSFPFLTHEISQLPNMAANLISNYAESLTKLPQENKDRLRLKLRTIVQEVKPFSDELKILWQDEETTNKQPLK